MSYETDFYAWTQQQAALLRRLVAQRINTDLDLEHLAEEIEDLGDQMLAVAEGLIVQILLHLLKLEFSPAEEPRLGWRGEIHAWRTTLRRRLRRAPSVVTRVDLVELYGDALEGALIALARDGIGRGQLPAACPYTLEQVIGAFLPANRHGLVDPV